MVLGITMEQPITVWLVILFLNSAFPQNSHRLSSAFCHPRGEYVTDPVSITKYNKKSYGYYTMSWGSKALCGDTVWRTSQ